MLTCAIINNDDTFILRYIKLLHKKEQNAQGGIKMAKIEKEEVCFTKWIDVRLAGLWSLIGSKIVYTDIQPDSCVDAVIDKAFSTDPIAYDLLSAIIKHNVNCDEVVVHQLHYAVSNQQRTADIQKVLADANNPQLIAAAGSNFVSIVADSDNNVDVWVWDLNSCQ